MRVIVVLIFFIAIITDSFAQNKFDFDNTTLVGKDKQIYSNRHIKIDQKNNKYIVGFFKGTIYIDTFSIQTRSDITNNPYENAQGIFLAKYNSGNEIISLVKIAEGDSIYYSPFALDTLSNLYFSISYSGILFYNNDSIISNGQKDGVIIKFDSLHNIKYTNKIGGINGERINIKEVSLDKNLNYFVSGYFNETWTGNFPNYKLGFGYDTITSSTLEMFIVKYNANGTPNWAKSYGGSGDDIILDLAYSEDYIYFIAVLNSPNNLNNIGGINISYPINYLSTCLIAKCDTNGNAIWVRRFGSKYNNALGYVVPTSIAVQNDIVYFTAFGNDQNQLEFLFDGGANLLGTGGANYESFIAAYDTLGNFIFRTLVPGVSTISQLTTDTNNNVIGVGGDDYSLKVVSYDSMGNSNWKVMSDADNLCTTVGSGIAKDSHGKLYVVGGTTCTQLYMGNDTLYPPANQSTMFFSSLDSIDANWAVGTTEISQSNTALMVYPNPASNEVVVSREMIDMKLEIRNMKNATIEISNTLGQLLHSSLISPLSSHFSIDVSKYPNGIYFLSYKNNQQSITQKIIIQH